MISACMRCAWITNRMQLRLKKIDADWKLEMLDVCVCSTSVTSMHRIQTSLRILSLGSNTDFDQIYSISIYQILQKVKCHMLPFDSSESTCSCGYHVMIRCQWKGCLRNFGNIGVECDEENEGRNNTEENVSRQTSCSQTEENVISLIAGDRSESGNSLRNNKELENER